MIERYMEFFGPHAMTFDDEQHVIGRFNKQLIDKCVVFMDEAFFAGNRKHAAKLKTLISWPTLNVEAKGMDVFIVPKPFRAALASNDEHIIAAERDDRRNFVLHVDAGSTTRPRLLRGYRREWNTGGKHPSSGGSPGITGGKGRNGAFRMAPAGDRRVATPKRPEPPSAVDAIQSCSGRARYRATSSRLAWHMYLSQLVWSTPMAQGHGKKMERCFACWLAAARGATRLSWPKLETGSWLPALRSGDMPGPVGRAHRPEGRVARTSRPGPRTLRMTRKEEPPF